MDCKEAREASLAKWRDSVDCEFKKEYKPIFKGHSYMLRRFEPFFYGLASGLAFGILFFKIKGRFKV